MMLSWFNDEERQTEFISDLKEVVENPETDIWTMSLTQVLEEDNETRSNILFVLEKVMQELGLVGVNRVPTENCLSIDPFTSSYTTYDMILVVCFLYISVIDKGAMRNPSNHCLVQDEELIRQRRVSQNDVNDRNSSRNNYKENKVGRTRLRDRWMPIEDKCLVSHWKWLQDVDKKAKMKMKKKDIVIKINY